MRPEDTELASGEASDASDTPRTDAKYHELSFMDTDKKEPLIWGWAEGLERELSAAPSAPSAWVSVKDRLPDEKFVLAFVDDGKGRTRRIRAFYAAKLSVESWSDDECYEYSEENDEYFLPEGWYEANEYEETHWFVHDPVTHWMPLPAAPSGGGE